MSAEPRTIQPVALRYRRRGKNNPDRKSKGRLIRADIALDQRKTDVYVTEYIEDSGDFPEFAGDRKQAREAAATIKGIFETIRKYQVPVVVLDSDAPLESVCRVFETINSTGTRLTTFDLAVARFYPRPDLREFWEEAKESHPILKHFEVEGERVLQVLALWSSHLSKTATEPTRSKLLSLDVDFVSKNWRQAAERLSEAYEWAKHNGSTPGTLPTHGILVSIAAFFALHPNINNDPFENHQSVLRRWYFSKVLQQGARQAANYKIGRDFDDLIAYAEAGEPLEASEVKLNADSINRIRRSSDNRYKALQSIMALTAAEDLISGRRLDDELEDHHIYPRSLRKTSGFETDRLDGITNRVLVSRVTNNRLSDKLPESYFGDLQRKAVDSGTEGDVNRRLKQCLIP